MTLVLLHGFMDSPVTWDLVRPHLGDDVLAPALPLDDPAAVVDRLEEMLDGAGVETAHLAGNSLGGYLALRLAERGRGRSVVALAPAGGWATAQEPADVLALQRRIHRSLQHVVPEQAVATAQGRRVAMRYMTVRWEHIPPELIAAQLRAAAATDVEPLIANALANGWPLDPARVTCPVRFVWGTADELLPWPTAATRYRAWFPTADWVVLDDVGHAPQLDVPLETAELIRGFG
ncbi:MAG TPA: alpha/beta hydrolase [Gaiellaceae bacterium]